MPRRVQAYSARQTGEVNKKTKEHSMGANFGTSVKLASRFALSPSFLVRLTRPPYSTVTDLARLRGLSTSVPRAQAVW